MMQYLQFALNYPIFSAIALAAITVCVCLVLEEIAGVVKAARGGK